MANWIKAIYFVVILAWVIYALSDDAVKYNSFPRRFGLSVALTVIIGLAGFALWHAAVPTSIKLLSEDSEVAESHSLASLRPDLTSTARRRSPSATSRNRMSMS